MPGADQYHQLHSSSSHQERTYILSRQECQEQINTIRFIPAPVTMRELTDCQEYEEQINTISCIPAPATIRELTTCQAKNHRSRSTPSASFQLQPPRENLLSVKAKCQEQINTITFIAAPATKRELTLCQAKNARRRSTPSASIQLKPPGENLLSVKPRMPGADQHHQLHSSSSHHERTYPLSHQECQEQINTIRFIPAPATMGELTLCQAKNARGRSTPSASFQLQPPRENLLPVKARMPGADKHHQLHCSSSHHERTYILSSQECQKQISTTSFIPALATMRELTDCEAKDARSR
jgi:hypothetical protein